MSEVLDSGLVKPDSGVQGWDAILNGNWDLLDDRLELILVVSSANRIGSQSQADAAEETVSELTDSTSGTQSNTIPGAGASYSESTLNNIHASLVEEINALRSDNQILRSTINGLISKLETMGVLTP